MNISSLAKNIYQEKGLWFSANSRSVSYPDEGNDACFQLEEISFWFDHRNKCIVSLVKSFAGGSVFFDIGGGNGFVSRALQNNGQETVLVEPGLKGCLNAQKRGLENIVCSTLEDAGFAPSSLDACGLFDVVEHISDDAAFMNNIYKFLKPGGYCFITVPAYSWLWSNEDVHAGHYRRYTSRSVTQLLNSCGFSVTYSTFLFSFLVLPVLLFRRIPSIWKKNRAPFKVNQREHRSNGAGKLMIRWLCNIELKRITQLKKISFGSSLLVVAKKPS